MVKQNFSKKKVQPVGDANSKESIKIEKNKTENIKKEKKKHSKKKEVIDLSMDDEEDLLGQQERVEEENEDITYSRS